MSKHFICFSVTVQSGLTCSALFGCILPPSKRSIYFHEKLPENSKNGTECSLSCDRNVQSMSLQGTCLLQNKDNLEPVSHLKALPNVKTSISRSLTNNEELSGFQKIKTDFLVSFSNLNIVKWSLWWALMQCGYLQVCKFIWKASLYVGVPPSSSFSQLYFFLP